jgi:hypothetical protein
VKQQKATLAKQREEYVKKSATLQRELEILRQQCDEIGKEGGRENNRIIKENQKLQVNDRHAVLLTHLYSVVVYFQYHKCVRRSRYKIK